MVVRSSEFGVRSSELGVGRNKSLLHFSELQAQAHNCRAQVLLFERPQSRARIVRNNR